MSAHIIRVWYSLSVKRVLRVYVTRIQIVEVGKTVRFNCAALPTFATQVRYLYIHVMRYVYTHVPIFDIVCPREAGNPGFIAI